ncbi:dynein axonemal heavy chain 5 [Anabrus simplex]|uniref:dynein axonemal heavy chain 5 n=1 Tax=Anabrus simplex TaxID=316456 RepID=UPI0034DDA74A
MKPIEDPGIPQPQRGASGTSIRVGMSTLFTDKSQLKLGTSIRMGTTFDEAAPVMRFSKMIAFQSRTTLTRASMKGSRLKSKTPTRHSTYALMMQENYRERMAKARSARMNRKGCLYAVHRFIFDVVSFHFNIDPQVVEDGVCDAQLHILLLDSLFSVGGRQAVLFIYQEMENPPLESGRFNPLLPKDQKMKRVVVSDGGDIETCGPSVVVYRTNCNISIDTKNMSEELYFRSVDLDSSYNNPVPGLIDIFSMSIKDRLRCSTHWGELKESEQGKATVATFLECVDIFVEFLQVTEVDLEGSMIFSVPDDLWTALSTPQQINKTINEPEIMEKVENVVQQWGQLIEKALTKDMEIRREKDTIGPLACLIYWRRLLAMNSSIVEHLKSVKCKNFILALQLSKSKYIKKWTTLENMVTNVNNEVEDNVKYLYALEKYLDPLYHTEPNAIDRYMPCLMYCIRMVYSTSRYFNTNDRLTGLLVKVTNQLITACQGYLTNNGTVSIWSQAKKEVLRKIKVCVGLHRKYADCFHQMKDADKEFPGAAPVDCSEVYIFGKLGAFQTRLERID